MVAALHATVTAPPVPDQVRATVLGRGLGPRAVRGGFVDVGAGPGVGAVATVAPAASCDGEAEDVAEPFCRGPGVAEGAPDALGVPTGARSPVIELRAGSSREALTARPT
jgi:hypothetical protein